MTVRCVLNHNFTWEFWPAAAQFRIAQHQDEIGAFWPVIPMLNVVSFSTPAWVRGPAPQRAAPHQFKRALRQIWMLQSAGTFTPSRRFWRAGGSCVQGRLVRTDSGLLSQLIH